MSVGKAKRLIVVTLITVGISVPFAGTAASAHAAGGKCQYGQKKDGSCWDDQAKADQPLNRPVGNVGTIG
jgi:hypothetical protein